MSKPYVLHWAGPDDLPEVMALLDERRRWLHERGSDQWSPDRAFATRMTHAVDRRETLLLRDDGVSIATVTVTPQGDPDFWTPDELKESALYLGKMASAVGRSGEGLGSLMLSWAQDWAARSGFDSLRWDVWRTNEQLQDYYRSIGGQYIRTAQAAHRWSGALFQIPARRIVNLSDRVITSHPTAADSDVFAGALDGPSADSRRSNGYAHQDTSLREGDHGDTVSG